MSTAEVSAFLSQVFPQVFGPGGAHKVEAVGAGTARVRMTAGERHLRPGGTVSGPAMMELADAAIYVAILGAIGPKALAVTTNLSINFLKKPEPGDLIADCKVLKAGKRLVVAEAAIRAEGDEELVAHCVATYSIPPE
ncbi:MAG: PaaI family thioesterase [Bradyrhizobiaceae bacterium]|nr:PaaI family thioesterase [Bradyrhizobiaceae bacterium]